MAAPVPSYTFRARPVRVLDGDTFEAVLDLGKFAGCKVEATVHIRVRDYSAPELRDPGGPEAAAGATELLMGPLPVVVRTYKPSFERTVADVWVGEDTLGDLMRARGL